MDAPIISENSLSEANPSAYSLTEIWPSPANGNGGVSNRSGGGLGVRMSSLSGSNHDVSVDESTIKEHSGSRGGGGGRKRSDANSEDESSKVVSTSSGNDLVIVRLCLRESKVGGNRLIHSPAAWSANI